MSAINQFAASFRLSEPATFLHSVDIDADRAVLFQTNRELLGQASFIDGRSDIALAPPQTVPLSEAMQSGAAVETAQRFVFNMSFCGSTLLCRLIDVPRRSLTLREPNCLAELAAWKTLNLRAGKPTDRLHGALRFASGMLFRPFRPDEKVTIKPSGWVNSLLGEIVGGASRLLPLFLTIDRQSFLRAVFRGGADRMTHTGQMAWHLASEVPGGDRLLKDAVDAGKDHAGKAANLATLAHHFQSDAFARAMQAGGWAGDRVIDFRDLASAPLDAAMRASDILELDLDRRDLQRNVDAHAGKHAKQPSLAFSAARLNAVDNAVLQRHQVSIDAALAWADRSVGAEAVLGAAVAA